MSDEEAKALNPATRVDLVGYLGADGDALLSNQRCDALGRWPLLPLRDGRLISLAARHAAMPLDAAEAGGVPPAVIAAAEHFGMPVLHPGCPNAAALVWPPGQAPALPTPTGNEAEDDDDGGGGVAAAAGGGGGGGAESREGRSIGANVAPKRSGVVLLAQKLAASHRHGLLGQGRTVGVEGADGSADDTTARHAATVLSFFIDHAAELATAAPFWGDDVAREAMRA